MKRYLLFGYDDYYPCGGWSDFVGQFDSIESAESYDPSYGVGNLEIVDLEVCEVVREAVRIESKKKYKWKDAGKS